MNDRRRAILFSAASIISNDKPGSRLARSLVEDSTAWKTISFSLCSVRFQNRRTKWKKTENISNAEAAEHKLGTRKMSSTSSSSFDHHRNQSVQLPNGSSVSSKSSTCSSVSSHRSDERVYSATSTSAPPPLPLLYFNSFSHLLQSSCSSNQDKLSSSAFDERCQSISPSPSSPLAPLPENSHCSPTTSIPSDGHVEDRPDDENTKPKCLVKQRPCSR